MTWKQMSMFTDRELGITPNYNLIGLTGYARTGKDTLASILVEKYGYRRIAFADTIRSFLYEVNPMVGCSPSGYLQDLVDLVGWDKAKEEPQVRRLLQDLGVAARKLINEDVWITAALADLDPHEKVVIADVRFENEAAMIRLLGGQLWRVKRFNTSAVNDHVSEIELDYYEVDQIFLNNGTIEDLEILLQVRMRNALPK
jgi:hypothetical protein